MKPLKAFLIICFFLNSPLFSQNNNTLRGKMLFLSSGKTPAQGVTISGSIKEIENTNTVYTTDDGSYVLIFPKARVGHRVALTIGEEDQHGKQIEVVNEKEIEICQISADYKVEFEIIVCPKGSRDLAAQKYYKIIKTSSDIALAKIKKEMDELIAQQEKDYGLITEYGERIATLEQQTDSLTIYREAFNIASINKDSASKRLLRYIQLLDEGRSIQEARGALSIKDAAIDLSKSVKQFKAGKKELETRAGASASIFDFEDAITCYDTIISYSEGMSIDPLLIAEYYNKSALILCDDGKYEKALKYFQEAIDIKEENLDPNHPHLAISYNNISLSYQGLGKYEKALEHQLKAIEIQEATSDSDNSDLAISYTNISTTYQGLGEYETALEYQLKAIEIQEALSDSDDSELAISYNNISLVYQGLGQYETSLEFQLKALNILEENLDPKHPEVATCLNNIGITFQGMGQYDKALEYLVKSNAIREEILNPNHPELAVSYSNIGVSCIFLGQYEKALYNFQKCREIEEKILKPNHPSLAKLYDNTGYAYSASGQFEKALEYQLNAIEIREKILKPNHPDLAVSYGNIGNTYESKREYEKALEYKQKSIDIFEDILDPDHPNLAISYSNISLTYQSMKQYDKALEYQLKAIEIREKILDPDHPGRASSYRGIGNIYLATGQYKKALEYQLKALSIYEKTLDPNHPELAMTYGYVGNTYYSLGQYENASEYQLKAIDILKQIAPDNNNLFVFYNNIGLTYSKNFQFKEANEVFKIHDNRFPNEGRSFRNWAMYYALKGDKEKALSNLKKAVELGYTGLKWLETDDSMDSLRNEEEFKSIIEYLKQEKK